jgi:hypothetical protein
MELVKNGVVILALVVGEGRYGEDGIKGGHWEEDDKKRRESIDQLLWDHRSEGLKPRKWKTRRRRIGRTEQDSKREKGGSLE